MGVGRVYVQTDGPLTFDRWVRGLAAGRSYVSDGTTHLMDFAAAAAGKRVEVGATGSKLALATGGPVALTVKAARHPGRKTVLVELVVNGLPVAKQELPADGVERELTFTADIARSSWRTPTPPPSARRPRPTTTTPAGTTGRSGRSARDPARRRPAIARRPHPAQPPLPPGRRPHAAGRHQADLRAAAGGYFTANVRHPPPACGFSGTAETDWNFTPPVYQLDTDRWADLKGRQPFFAQVDFQETHRHFYASKKADPAKVEVPPYEPDHPITRADRAAYLDAATELDRKVGLVLKQLDDGGLDGNTLVVFFADNGQAHVRGKRFCYEEGRFRYIRNFTPDRPFLQANAYKEKAYPGWNLLKEPHAAGKLTPAQAALCQPTMPAEELYDLRADPHQVSNLAGQPEHKATQDRLAKALADWIESTGDQGRTPEPPEVVRLQDRADPATPLNRGSSFTPLPTK